MDHILSCWPCQAAQIMRRSVLCHFCDVNLHCPPRIELNCSVGKRLNWIDDFRQWTIVYWQQRAGFLLSMYFPYDLKRRPAPCYQPLDIAVSSASCIPSETKNWTVLCPRCPNFTVVPRRISLSLPHGTYLPTNCSPPICCNSTINYWLQLL